MTKDIKDLRNRKFPDPFDFQVHPSLKVLPKLFFMLALGGFLICGTYSFFAKDLDSLLVAYLYGTSAGCLITSIGYLAMRKKVKQMNQYQEEMVQAIYNCLKHVEKQAEKHNEQYYDLKYRLKTLTYMTFRHTMCPDVEQFKGFMDVMEGDLSRMDIDDELRKKLEDELIDTPCAIINQQDWLFEILNDGSGYGTEYWKLHEKLYSLHPFIVELDVIPDLLKHVLDSVDNYSLTHYERK